MPRRIWVAEGFASDGDVYGRTLQIPDGNMRNSAAQDGGTDVQRTHASVIKSHLGDVTSCPCLAAMMPEDDSAEQPAPRGD